MQEINFEIIDLDKFNEEMNKGKNKEEIESESSEYELTYLNDSSISQDYSYKVSYCDVGKKSKL